jgi:hypothetical protein
MRAQLLFAAAFLAAALLTAIPPAAQDAASARALLTNLFRRYTNGGREVDYKSRYFHSSLVVLVYADIKAAGTDIPGAALAILLKPL